MNNLLGLLMSSMTSQSTVNAASKKTGLSGISVATILSYALPLILKAMTSNASSKPGATSLLSALTQHTSKRSMPEQIELADQADGEKIIGHIFGNDAEATTAQIARAAGVSNADVTNVLSSIAPALLSSLSAFTTTASQQQAAPAAAGPDLSALTGILGNSGGMANMLGALFGGAQAPAAQAAPAAGADDGTALLTSLLSLMK
ncbi:MAG: DUF937 domain-containing protein [Solobacterium sp.]|nr:DUF937 domain-containing protein [Solobacterium sp.]